MASSLIDPIRGKWRLAEALMLIRALQPQVKPMGFHVALGGGVLNRGESLHDLDLYFLPLDNGQEASAEKLISYLVEMWGKGEDINQTRHPRLVRGSDGLLFSEIATYPDTPNSPYTHKITFYLNGRERIDVFILGRKEAREEANEESITSSAPSANSMHTLHEWSERFATVQQQRQAARLADIQFHQVGAPRPIRNRLAELLHDEHLPAVPVEGEIP